MMKSYIEKKAFEVSTTTIERISDFSSFALLERTYENRLSLDDAIGKVQGSNIDGLIGVSIYQRQKSGNAIKFNYLSGFGDDVKDIPIDKQLQTSLDSSNNEDVSYDDYIVKSQSKDIDTYRFIRPIIYKYQNSTILLGVAILYYDKNAINDIIKKLDSDTDSDKAVKNAAKNQFINANNWGVFDKDGTPLKDLAKGGQVTILDVSCYATMQGSWKIKNLVYVLTSKSPFPMLIDNF